jgi:putative ABC transport system permease protein
MKTALRMYLRQILLHPFQTVINHIGYAIGLASVILILFWIRDETSYDKFHENRDRIFRVNSVQTDNSSNINTNSPFPLTPNMKKDYPDIEMQTRYWNVTGIARIGDNYYREKDMYLIDNDFFKIFNIHFIKGNPEEALLNLNSLILTESGAKKFFGEKDPVGIPLAINDKDIFTITAVISDPPQNSYLQYEMLGNINLVPELRLNSWYFAGQSYVMLKKGVNYKDLNKKLEGYYSKFTNTIEFNPILQNIGEIYLNEYGVPGRIKYVRIFSMIGLFILLMINFNNWNLTYVMILKREKEISMRQVNGASEPNIIGQFMLEAFISMSVSLIVAIELVQLVWNMFNNITGKDINLWADPVIALVLAIILLINIIISGIYPFIIAKKGKEPGILYYFRPQKAIQPKISPVLTIIQISLSVFILICTIIVFKQLNYIRSKDLGFNRESVLYFPMNEIFRSKYDLIKKELLLIPEIESVTAASTLPTEINWWISINWEGQTESTPLELAYAIVDYDYFKTLNIDLLEGRSFSEQLANDDSVSYMISELAMKQMEIKDPVGKRITMNHNEFPERFRDGRIIGVFKDIHFTSLRNPSNPLLLRMYKPWLLYILVKCKSLPDNNTITKISGILKNITPGLENEVYFLDSEFDRQYKQEIVTGKLLKNFSIISLCIYVLGLLGLISFLTQNKTKEIGIRKVNGAKATEILVMLNKNFTKWVILAFLAAAPVAWYVMDKWLENFAFKTNQDLWIYLIVAALSIVITILTMSWQSWRAATRNPIEALRYE